MTTVYTSKNGNFNIDIDKFYKTYLDIYNRVEKINIQLENGGKSILTIQNKVDELNKELLGVYSKVLVTHNEFDDCKGEIKYMFGDFYLDFKMKKFKYPFHILLLKKVKLHREKKFIRAKNSIRIEKIDEELFKKRLLDGIEGNNNFKSKVKKYTLEKFKTEVIIGLIAGIVVFMILNYYNLW